MTALVTGGIGRCRVTLGLAFPALVAGPYRDSHGEERAALLGTLFGDRGSGIGVSSFETEDGLIGAVPERGDKGLLVWRRAEGEVWEGGSVGGIPGCCQW